MPKKLCCCTNKQTCPWCDKGYYLQDGPVFYNGLTGTVATELPSIGHPYFINWPDTNPSSGLCAYNHFRTIPPIAALQGVTWPSEQPYYGDIYPCWFNGINMNQSLTSEDTNAETAYFEFLFKLKIEKQLENQQYETIVDIDWNGYGKNLRPHPDACQSYNLTNNLFSTTICQALNEDLSNNCTIDFARMPRGPWPYRLKTGTGGPLDSGDIELDELSDEGTPYGWEDCPSDCPNYSNYGTPVEKLKFFRWLSPHCRYTTPEWDVSDFTKNGNRKLSIHCLVPSKVLEEQYGDILTPWCNPEGNAGQSYGEWCFGMDLESLSEITTLDNEEFPWSNGRESDGFWINKTPTGALRVLFTLDHAELEPGKVFRVFRDWHVQNGTHEIYRINSQSKKFKITFEQKLTERIFSSLGCDCPQGNCERTCDPDSPNYPLGCHTPTIEQFWPCWTCNLSFTERGPIFVTMNPTTKNTGIVPNVEDDKVCEPGSMFSTELCENTGLIMFADSALAANGRPYEPALYPNDFSRNYGNPFLDHVGDIPYGPGSGYSVITNNTKYRYIYRAIKLDTGPKGYGPEDPAFYPYGWRQCTKADGSQIFTDPYNIFGNKDVYALPPIKVTPWPQKHYLGGCTIRCGCPSVGDCNQGSGYNTPLLASYNDGGPSPAPNFPGHPEPSDDTQTCDCPAYWLCHPNSECVSNLLREEQYGFKCGSNCYAYPEDCHQAGINTMDAWCSQSPGYESLGMGCDFIFFNAYGQSITYGGLGPPACACVCGDDNEDNSGGVESCYEDGRCKFCGGGGSGVAAGFLLNTSVNWREMLCYRAKNNPNKLRSVIPPNIMGNLKLKCELAGNCPNENAGLTNIHGKCDCEFLNSYGNGTICSSTDGVVNTPYLQSIADSGMDIQGQIYEINFTPYSDLSAAVANFKAYPTKYKEQYFSPRIPKYIKINSQGPFIS